MKFFMSLLASIKRFFGLEPVAVQSKSGDSKPHRAGNTAKEKQDGKAPAQRPSGGNQPRSENDNRQSSEPGNDYFWTPAAVGAAVILASENTGASEPRVGEKQKREESSSGNSGSASTGADGTYIHPPVDTDADVDVDRTTDNGADTPSKPVDISPASGGVDYDAGGSSGGADTAGDAGGSCGSSSGPSCGSSCGSSCGGGGCGGGGCGS